MSNDPLSAFPGELRSVVKELLDKSAVLRIENETLASENATIKKNLKDANEKLEVERALATGLAQQQPVAAPSADPGHVEELRRREVAINEKSNLLDKKEQSIKMREDSNKTMQKKLVADSRLVDEKRSDLEKRELALRKEREHLAEESRSLEKLRHDLAERESVVVKQSAAITATPQDTPEYKGLNAAYLALKDSIAAMQQDSDEKGDSLKRLLSSQAKEIESLTQDRDELFSKLAARSEEVDVIAKASSALERELQQVKDEASNLQKRCGQLEARLEAQAYQSSQHESSLEIDTKLKQLADAETKGVEREKRLKDAAAALKIAKRANDEQREGIARDAAAAAEQLAQAKELQRGAAEREEALERQRAKLEKERDEARTAVEAGKAQMAEASAEASRANERLQARVDELSREREQLQQALASASTDSSAAVAHHTARADELQARVDELARERDEQQKDLVACRKRMHELEAATDEFSSKIRATEAEMKETNGRLEEALSDVEKYRVAAATATGSAERAELQAHELEQSMSRLQAATDTRDLELHEREAALARDAAAAAEQLAQAKELQRGAAEREEALERQRAKLAEERSAAEEERIRVAQEAAQTSAVAAAELSRREKELQSRSDAVTAAETNASKLLEELKKQQVDLDADRRKHTEVSAALMRDRAALEVIKKELEKRQQDASQLLQDAQERVNEQVATAEREIRERESTLAKREEEATAALASARSAALEARIQHESLTKELNARAATVTAQAATLRAYFGGSGEELGTQLTTLKQSRWTRPSLLQPLAALGRPAPLSDSPSVAEQKGIAIERWGLDIAACAEKEPHMLQIVGMEAARRWGVVDTVVPAEVWAQFLAVVESGYVDTPYHNAVHAADITHSLFALVEAAPALVSQMTSTERFAAVFAAVIHDFRHPGRNNLFLSRIFDPAALRCANQSVLEMTHVVSAFALMADAALDCTVLMDDGTALQFHQMVTAMVLATDMSKHSAHFNKCHTRATGFEGAAPFDFSKTTDRVEMLSLLLHAADIGASAKPIAVADTWAGRVTAEFLAQGCDEERRGLPISPGCSSSSSSSISIAQSQCFFIDTFVAPLFQLIGVVLPAAASAPLQFLSATKAHWAAKCSSGTSLQPLTPPTSVSAERASKLEAELQRCEAQLCRVAAVQQQLEERAAEVASRHASVTEEERQLAAQKASLEEREAKVSVVAIQLEALEAKEAEIRNLLQALIDVQVNAVMEKEGAGEVRRQSEEVAMRESVLAERERILRETENANLDRAKVLAREQEAICVQRRDVEAMEAALTDDQNRANEILRRECALEAREAAAARNLAKGYHISARAHLADELASRAELSQLRAEDYLRAAREYCHSALQVKQSIERRRAELLELMEREDAIRAAVEASRHRRQLAAQSAALRKGRGDSADAPLDRLERSVYSLTTYLASCAE